MSLEENLGDPEYVPTNYLCDVCKRALVWVPEERSWRHVDDNSVICEKDGHGVITTS